jgi:hypothetical protein
VIPDEVESVRCEGVYPLADLANASSSSGGYDLACIIEALAATCCGGSPGAASHPSGVYSWVDGRGSVQRGTTREGGPEGGRTRDRGGSDTGYRYYDSALGSILGTTCWAARTTMRSVGRSCYWIPICRSPRALAGPRRSGGTSVLRSGAKDLISIQSSLRVLFRNLVVSAGDLAWTHKRSMPTR